MTPMKRKAFSPWMGTSVVLHLLLLAVLYMFIAPPTESLDETRERHMNELSKETLEEAAEKLEELNREKLERNIERLEEIKQEMKEMERRQAEKLAQEKKERPKEAMANAKALLDQILERQLVLIEAQKQLTPKIAAAGKQLQEQIDMPRDEKRLRSFADGAGRAALEKFLGLREVTGGVGKEIDAIQELQARLAAEIAWLNKPTLSELQMQAIKAQEHSGHANGETSKRLAWLGRDLRDLPAKLDAALRPETDPSITGRRRERAERKRAQAVNRAHGAIAYESTHIGAVKTHHAEAIPAQQAAYEAQLKLKEAMEDMPPPEPLKPEEMIAKDSKPTDADATESEKPKLSELYEKGVEIEKDIAELTASIRATSISSTSDTAPSTTKDTVQSEAPDRPSVDADTLDGDPSSGSAYESFKKELATAVSTTDSMVNSAEAALGSAVASTSATEGEGEGEGEGDEGGEEGGEEAGGVPGGIWGTAGEGLVSNRKGSGGGVGGGEKGDGTKAARDLEAERAKMMAAVNVGRVIPPDDGNWMFIDGWYMIGPFTNGTSTSLDYSYTPEQVVDLGATYRGPDGRTLKWTFRLEPRPGTSYFPNQAGNSVSYAFTHLKAPRDMKVYLALASDDASTIWINGEKKVAGPTWHETEKNNSWMFSFGEDVEGYKSALHYRGYRQTTLKKGVNTILLRVENGPGRSGFAVYVKPAG